MSCVQAFTAALGFAMSAGWDLLPSMDTLWLRDYIEAVSMPTPFGFFGTLSGSIFFKMIMLLALCPVMERLFHAFPLDRVAFRRKPFPNADYALLPPALRERIYLSTPLILAQLCAILLLAPGLMTLAEMSSAGSLLHTALLWLSAALLLWVPIYLLLMQKRVYGQNWLLTLVKFALLGQIHFVLAMFGLLFSLAVSLVVM